MSRSALVYAASDVLALAVLKSNKAILNIWMSLNVRMKQIMSGREHNIEKDK